MVPWQRRWRAGTPDRSCRESSTSIATWSCTEISKVTAAKCTTFQNYTINTSNYQDLRHPYKYHFNHSYLTGSKMHKDQKYTVIVEKVHYGIIDLYRPIGYVLLCRLMWRWDVAHIFWSLMEDEDEEEAGHKISQDSELHMILKRT